MPKPGNVPPNSEVRDTIPKIVPRRLMYSTRRIAAQVSRERNCHVNRKAVRRAFKRLGWSEPTCTKREIIRANKKIPKPDAPNRFWKSDMSYIWCGIYGWRYCFNVVDVFTRR